MTPEIFLDMLVSNLTVLLSDCLLPTKTGARRAPKVYKHDLPVPQMDDEDEDADAEDVTAPFVIVRATGGTFDGWSDLHHVVSPSSSVPTMIHRTGRAQVMCSM